MKCLGVDIGSSSIKIAEVEGAGRGATLNQIWELKLSTDPGNDQTIEIIEKLRAFSSQYIAASGRPSEIKWIMGVPQRSVSTRLKRFPFADRPKVLKSLPFELEEEIPFDTSETIFDGRIIETFANGSDVLAVACPHAPVLTAINQAKDGGFEASLISCEGLALSNILDAWWAAPPHSPLSVTFGDDIPKSREVHAAHAILQVGHTQTNLIVYRDNRVVAIRSIPWGGHDVALNIESVFKISYVEAIKVLQSKSFVLLNTTGVSRDQMAMHKAVADSATGLIRELRTTILDLRTSAGADVQSLRLTGGAGQIQNFGPWLTQALEVNVNPLDYFTALSTNGKVQIRVNLNPEIENIAATAIGLALEGLRKPRNPAIDLRKGPFAQSNESVRLFWETWGTTLQLAAATFLVFSIYAFTRESMTLALAEQSDVLLSDAAKNSAGLKGAQATSDGVARYIRTESTSIKNRETLAQLDEYVSAMDFVLRMAERFPVQIPPKEGRGLDVDHLRVENEDLVIEGRAHGTDILPAVEKELQQIARGGKLTKTTPTQLRKGGAGTPFAFTMKINRKP